MKNDKLKHFIVGLILGLLTLPISWQTGFTWAAVITLFCGSIIFVGKEMYDERKKYPTGFDKRDLLADYMGLFIGYVIVFVIKWIIYECK